MAGLGWVDLVITAVSTGISIWQGAKAKKKQQEAYEKALAEKRKQEAHAHFVAQENWRKQMYDILLEQKNEDAVEAKKQQYLKYAWFAIAGISGVILIKRLRKKNKKTKKK